MTRNYPTGPRPGTEQVVLTTAARLLADDGPASLGVTRVAQVAGVSRATIYRSWPTTDDLIADVVCHIAAGLDPLPTDDPVTVPGAARAAAVALERRDVRAAVIAAVELANRGVHPHALQRIGDVVLGPIALAQARHGLPRLVDDLVSATLLAAALVGPSLSPAAAEERARRIVAPYPQRRPVEVVA